MITQSSVVGLAAGFCIAWSGTILGAAQPGTLSESATGHAPPFHCVISPEDRRMLCTHAAPLGLDIAMHESELHLQLDTVRDLGRGRHAWFGRVRSSNHSSVTLVVSDLGTIAGAIRPGDGRVIELRPGLTPGVVLTRALDVATLATCAGGIPVSRSRKSASESETRAPQPRHARIHPADGQRSVRPALRAAGGAGHFCDDGSQIDVLVLYTIQARAAAGGTAQMQALIDLALADTNAAFTRSGINTSVFLVHSQEVTYAESGNWAIDGPRLVDPNDGFVDEAHALRDQYGADCVSLWVDQLNTGGIGYFPDPTLTGVGASGFSLLRDDNAALLTMAHEFGHNLFCTHDRANTTDIPWAEYAYGYVEPGSQWQTLMGVAAGIPAIAYFANPSVSWPGPSPPNPGPTGVAQGFPNPCDTARTINETSIHVANFRPTAVPGLPGVLRVDAAAPPGGDGATWAAAIHDLREATCLAGGANGAVSEIWVRAGTYTPDSGGGDRSRSFGLVDGVALLGGFGGTETVATQRDPVANVTILSGEIGSPGTSVDNSYHVVDGSACGATAILDGFTIRDGFADADPNDGGGGIRIYGNGNPTIRNCDIRENAAMRGAGVYCAWGATGTLEDCTIHLNVALSQTWPAGGAGVHCYVASSPTLRRCVIRDNFADFGAGMAVFFGSSPTLEECDFIENDGGASGLGGGIYNYSQCAPTLDGCSFDNNYARYGLGLAALFECDPVLRDCVFVNHVRPTDGEGGGLYFYTDCAPELTDCLIADNHAQYGGGLRALFGSTPRLVNCVLRGNAADGDGGGINNYSDSAATLINCLLTGNTAPFGGAIGNSFASEVTLINCTLAGNVASIAGGGMYNYESDPLLRNTILWDNSVGASMTEVAQVDGFTSTPDLQHCIVQGWTGSLGGMQNNGSDPLLRDGDGFDDAYGTPDDDARLAAGSPAIDTGLDAYVPGGITADLLNRPRFAGLAVDRGAYEYGITPGDIDQNGVSDTADLVILLDCLNGPDNPPLAAVPYSVSECLAAFDGDLDGDIDLSDVAALQASW